MVNDLVLSSGPARAAVSPARGGALASLAAGGLPVLSAGEGRPPGPFALACNLLAPFSNRISRPLAWDGRTHPLPPNLAGEPFPIHGDAFQRPWQVASAETARAVLRLPDGAFGPWRYEAEATWHLSPHALHVTLRLVSRADMTLPWGLGFHPWFPRDAGTRARFAAAGWWPQDDRHLPRGPAPEPLPPTLDFSAPRPFPEGWLNAAFDGWDGTAEVLQTSGRAVSVRLAARGLGTLLAYSPGASAPFLCLEPVSHPVDAHSLPDRPGLVPLAPGETLEAAMTLDWSPSGTP
ncbi:aldose 1-epimerase [Rubellimicrobium sp. CFH 75288]|uniref:aldose 1-epimerase n=1 Tax=Rubellimicrobium sp. CFH 75288 TaxID=2697034 RepID=UPI001411C209|nr:aldose 1-epimerase [Rubellimicrobium sp. CFH 75288]NAZ36208.1 aldose 1-epimerase [Rubellimicrobium sp. CFH 75288]